RPTEVVGPLAAQIFDESADTERLGEQLKTLDDQVTAATAIVDAARVTWQSAADRLAAVRAQVSSVATRAYQQADALGPFDEYADQLQQFGLVAPALQSQVDGARRPSGRDTLLRDLRAAEAAEPAARAAYDTANAALTELAARRDLVAQQFHQHQAALKTLQVRNADALAAAHSARDPFHATLNPQ